jgi:excisionase family DNA binding protein
MFAMAVSGPRMRRKIMSRRKEWSESTKFLTPWQFARLLNVAEATVYRKLASSELEGVRIGRSWRLPVSQLPGFDISAEPCEEGL